MLSLEVLRAEKISALKQKDKLKASTISVLLGDLLLIDKDGGDVGENVIVSMIAKARKKASSNHDICLNTGRSEGVALYSSEIEIYDYLSGLSGMTLLGDSEILALIDELGATTMADMGKVMSYLKENFDGRFNPSVASGLVMKKLSK